jgi:hypothetical protein
MMDNGYGDMGMYCITVMQLETVTSHSYQQSFTICTFVFHTHLKLRRGDLHTRVL